MLFCGTAAHAYESFTAAIPVDCFDITGRGAHIYSIKVVSETPYAPAPVDDELIVSENGTGSIEFIISEPGTFRYRIYEIEGDDPAILYDTSVYSLSLIVEINDEGNLAYAVTVGREGDPDKVGHITFRNVVSSDSLETTTSTATTSAVTTPAGTTMQTTAVYTTTAAVTTKPAETGLITVLIEGVLTGDTFPAHALRITILAAGLTTAAALLFKRKEEEEDDDE